MDISKVAFIDIGDELVCVQPDIYMMEPIMKIKGMTPALVNLIHAAPAMYKSMQILEGEFTKIIELYESSGLDSMTPYFTQLQANNALILKAAREGMNVVLLQLKD